METPPDIALDRVGSATDPHRRAQERSLAAHRLIAARLLDDSAVVERAKGRLERWIREGRIHPEWASRWGEVLARPPKDIADVLVGSRSVLGSWPSAPEALLVSEDRSATLETSDAVRDLARNLAHRAAKETP